MSPSEQPQNPAERGKLRMALGAHRYACRPVATRPLTAEEYTAASPAGETGTREVADRVQALAARLSTTLARTDAEDRDERENELRRVRRELHELHRDLRNGAAELQPRANR